MKSSHRLPEKGIFRKTEFELQIQKSSALAELFII